MITLKFFRIIALIVLIAGAVGSLVLVLNGGHPPILLRILFIGWVLSPFMALLVANLVSRSWSVRTRVTIYTLMLVITLGSLFGLSGWSPPGTKPAFMFLIVPLILWLLIMTAILIARKLSSTDSNLK